MRIVVTGPGGFLAARTVARLRDLGHRVDGIGRGTDPGKRATGLITGHRLWSDVDVDWLADSDALIHAATCYGRAGESVDEVDLANHRLPRALAETAQRAGVRHLVVIDTALDAALSPYAAAKARLRGWLDGACADGTAPPATSLRTQHFYGPGDDAAKFTARVVRALAAGEPSLALSEGLQRRDFLHVDDAADAIALIATTAPPTGHRTIDLGSGSPVSIREFVALAAKLSGASTRLDFGLVPTRPGEPATLVADPRALAALGWRPRIGLEAGLRAYLDDERRILSNSRGNTPCAS